MKAIGTRICASFAESWALVALLTVPTARWHADVHTRPRPDVRKHAEAASAAQVLPLLFLGDH